MKLKFSNAFFSINHDQEPSQTMVVKGMYVEGFGVGVSVLKDTLKSHFGI